MPPNNASRDVLLALRERDEQKALDRKTVEIARQHGCDRGTFSVCWGELEQGLVCRCKAFAEVALTGGQTYG